MHQLLDSELRLHGPISDVGDVADPYLQTLTHRKGPVGMCFIINFSDGLVDECSGMFCFVLLYFMKQHKSELISARNTQHNYNNNDLSRLR